MLAGVAERWTDDQSTALSRLGVGEDDVGVLATELEADRSGGSGRRRGDDSAGAGLAVKCDPVKRVVVGQRFADGVGP